jgi:hypothetical protein
MSVYSHSGHHGDLIYALSSIKDLGGGDLILFPAACTGHWLTRGQAEKLIPFLQVQPYLHHSDWAPEPAGKNLDGFRNHYRADLNLADMQACWLGLEHYPREQPWTTVDRLNSVARVVFHRSPRYHNPNFSWKRLYRAYEKEAIFIGGTEEHAAFCAEIGPISYLYTRTWLDLARIIAGCELFCGNQSGPRALAESLKVPVYVEVDPTVNNTQFDRRGAIYGVTGDEPVPALGELRQKLFASNASRAIGYSNLAEPALLHLARLAFMTRSVAGDVAEIGTSQGGSVKVIGSMCPGKRVHIYGPWGRSPAPLAEGSDVSNRAGYPASPPEALRNFLSLYHCTYHTMLCGDSLRAVSGSFSLVNVQAGSSDIVSLAIQMFLPRLSRGGIMVFNGYCSPESPDVSKAVHQAGLPVESQGEQAWIQCAE